MKLLERLRELAKKVRGSSVYVRALHSTDTAGDELIDAANDCSYFKVPVAVLELGLERSMDKRADSKDWLLWGWIAKLVSSMRQLTRNNSTESSSAVQPLVKEPKHNISILQTGAQEDFQQRQLIKIIVNLTRKQSSFEGSLKKFQGLRDKPQERQAELGGTQAA